MRSLGFVSVAVISLGLSGCISTTGTVPFGPRSSQSQAGKCVSDTQGYRAGDRRNVGGYGYGEETPQIMTYNPTTRTETRLTENDSGISIQTQGQRTNTRLKTYDDNFAFSATNKERTTAVGVKGSSSESARIRPSICHEAGPGDEDGAVAGAIIGGAIGAASARPLEGAAVGAAVGAAIGAEVAKGN